MKKWLPVLVLLPFTVFSLEVVMKEGPLGFLTLAGREPWGMQILLDLFISIFLVGGWIRGSSILPMSYRSTFAQRLSFSFTAILLPPSRAASLKRGFVLFLLFPFARFAERRD